MSDYLNRPLRAEVKIISFDMVSVEDLLSSLGADKFTELLNHISETLSTDILERIYNKDPHEIKDFLKDKLIK